MEPGTKVMIEAVVQPNPRNYIQQIVLTKSGKTLYVDQDDLTVCEKAEVIDINNFCIGITDPVNAELLPGFKEWLGKTYWDRTYIYQGKYNGNWIGHISKPDNLTTLPELQKQHPGVFDLWPTEQEMFAPIAAAMNVPDPQQIEVGDVVRTDSYEDTLPNPPFIEPMKPLVGKEGVVTDTESYADIIVKHPESDEEWHWPPSACTLIRKGSTPSFKAGQEVEAQQAGTDKNWLRGIFLCVDENMPLVKFISKEFGIEYIRCFAIRPIPAQPTVESAEDELSKIVTDYPNNDQTLSQYIDTILAWHQKHSGRVEVSVPTVDEIMKYYDTFQDHSLAQAITATVRHFMTRKEQQG